MVLKALASDLPRLPANSKVWVQGTVLLLEGSPPNGTKALVLDDGSGLLHVDMQEYPCDLRVQEGDYCLAIAFTYQPPENEVLGSMGSSKLTLIPEKLKNITEDPDRETLWFLEIVESRSSLLQGLQAGKSESGGDQP
mmetsp:Transcript_5418/g.19812  ORF Transcript_5418/g.19812 Transcript_5418/m.19812 type:complete len:138 (+) Transcript_5418:176-589(+)